jgi:nicotinamidase-related amidase
MAEAQRDWEEFVLLLVDLQRDFWSERVSESFPRFPAQVSQLLTFCRSEGIEVVHLRASFKPDGSDWMPMYRLRGRIPCVEGTEGVETLAFALEEPGEKVITKQTFDGFQVRQLLQYLQSSGKRFVLVAGLVTSVCVLFTAVSAAQRGFLTAIVEDCCADRLRMHEQTLDTYQFIFERVTSDLIRDRHPHWQAAVQDIEDMDQDLAHKASKI